MPASATASSVSSGEHPRRPRVPEDAPRRRAGHAEWCRREHDRREPPGPRVRRRCRRVAAAHGLRSSSGRERRSSCCGRGARAAGVLSPAGRPASRCWTRPASRRARSAGRGCSPAGVGETTAGLGSGLMSACAPATGSASDTLSRAQTQAVARIRLNDGRRVGRHRHSPLLAGTCTILLSTLRLPLVRLPRRRRTERDLLRRPQLRGHGAHAQGTARTGCARERGTHRCAAGCGR